jgi:hypothetical protein
MVNKNHFQFDYKSFFNFLKTIYGFKNRKWFSEIELFILVRTFDIRLTKLGHGRLSKSKQRRMPANQIPAKTGWNSAMVRSQPDLAKMVGIRPDLARIQTDPVTDPAESG